jgi:hypothetical protein
MVCYDVYFIKEPIMTRNELKEIIVSVIERLKEGASAPACGIQWTDDPVQVTTLYGIGEESGSPEPKPTPDPVVTTRYAIGEEDVVTTRYSVGEEG